VKNETGEARMLSHGLKINQDIPNINKAAKPSGDPKLAPDQTCTDAGWGSIFVSTGISKLPDVEISGKSAASGDVIYWQRVLGPIAEAGSGESGGGPSSPLPVIDKETRCRSEFEACIAAAEKGKLPGLLGDFCIVATAKGGARWGGWVGALIGAGCGAGREYYIEKATTECWGKRATCFSS
jgi:hypothetical protein